MNETVLYLRRAATSGLLNSATSAACVAVVLPAVIGNIGLDAYGYWAILGVFVAAAGLLDLGMSKALVFLIPRGESPEGEIVYGAMALCLGATLAAAALVLFLAASGVPIFGVAVAHEPGLTILLAAAGAAILVCQVLTTLVRAVLEARRKAYIVNIGFAVHTLVYYGLATLLSLYASDLRLIVVASTGVFALTLAAHVQLLWADRPLRWQRPARATLRRLVHVAKRTFAIDLPSIAYLPILLWVFLAFAHSGGAYAVFELAMRIAVLCATALGTLAVPFFALIAGAPAIEQQQLRKLLERFVTWMLLLATGGWAVVFLFGERLLRWWMPAAPPELAGALRWLLGGALLYAAFEPVTRMLLGLGRARHLLTVRLTMLATCAVLVLALHSLPALQRFSIAGAAGWTTAALLLALALRSVRWGRSAA